MKIAIITDSSAVLNPGFAERENVFVLDIPVSIDGVDYVEGVNLTAQWLRRMNCPKQVSLV